MGCNRPSAKLIYQNKNWINKMCVQSKIWLKCLSIHLYAIFRLKKRTQHYWLKFVNEYIGPSLSNVISITINPSDSHHSNTWLSIQISIPDSSARWRTRLPAAVRYETYSVMMKADRVKGKQREVKFAEAFQITFFSCPTTLTPAEALTPVLSGSQHILHTQ